MRLNSASLMILLCLILFSPTDARAQEQARQVTMTTYCFIVDTDVGPINSDRPTIAATEFRDKLNQLVREGKAIILSNYTRTIRVGETFSVQKTDAPDKSETIQIATGEYGDGERQVSLSINVRKMFGTERIKGGPLSNEHFDVVIPHAVVPNNSTLNVGGQKWTREMPGKKKGKKKGEAVIYFAIEVISKK